MPRLSIPQLRPRIPNRSARRTMLVALTLVALMLPLSGGVIAEGSTEAPGSSQSAARSENGWILVATPPVSRTQAFSSLNGITHVTITVLGDAPFILRPYYGAEAGACLVVCAELADFDIAFLAEDGTGTAKLLARHADAGEESGRTPESATMAIVYLRTPGVVPDGIGYRFEYLEGDPGADSMPDA